MHGRNADNDDHNGEHTKRKDYEILEGYNRHTIAPWGWAHEQDNTKIQLRDGQRLPLAREWGLNTYKRVTDVDFQAARDFWNRDGAFWGAVVAAWDEVQRTRSEFTIHDRLDVPRARDSRQVRAQRRGQSRTGRGVGCARSCGQGEGAASGGHAPPA